MVCLSMRVSNFKTTTTPCFLLLLLVCSFYWCEGCLDEERNALLQIKESVGYLKRTSLWGLWVGNDCCQWIGVSCQDDSASSSHVHVVSLDLGGFVEEGQGTWYPNATLFALFRRLESLHLSDNEIGGWVMPLGFTQMKSLQNLKLWNNRLNESINSLSALCGLRNLASLDLSFNNLDDGDIPPCLLSNLSSLESLHLIGNNLRSSHGFSQLKSLTLLYIRSNRLNESMSGLCGLINLQALDLSDNNLHDANLPPCLCELGSIEQLSLGDNNLDGQNLRQCLSNFSSLQILSLENNNLGDKFNVPRGSLELPNLRSLDVRGNHLTNENIGPWITNLTSLASLYLSGNNLKSSSILIGLCNLRNLNTLWLQNNSFEGQIPTCFKDMYSLNTWYLSFNEFSGSIHPSIFRNLTMMASIDFSNNKLNGVIPFSMFANLSKLMIIDISNNPQAKVETEHTHWTPTFQLWELILTRCNLSDQSILSFLYSQQNMMNFGPILVVKVQCFISSGLIFHREHATWRISTIFAGEIIITAYQTVYLQQRY